jgi:N-acetylmuramoyl-L-alanine amidase
MALKRVWIPSPNYSGRGGSSTRLVVLHTTEGAMSYQSLGSFFGNKSSAVSSHVGIDDTPGTVGEYVARGNKAWTQGNANPYSVAAELCAYASWSSATWQAHPQMLANAAAWVAEESQAFGIPVTRLTAAQAQDGRSKGVCMHVDLGAAGGGHWDCGPNFPIDQVVAMAGGQTPGPAPGPPAPTPDYTQEDNMVLTDPTTGGVWVVAPDAIPGAVWTYDGAPFLGGTNNTKMNAGKYPCVGIGAYQDPAGAGYTLVLDWGDSGKGDGKSKDGSGDRYRRYHFSRSGSGK